MPNQIDFSLPTSLPADFDRGSNPLQNLGVYTLCDLGLTGVSDLVIALNSAPHLSDNCRLAPTYDFSSTHSLRSIRDYHLSNHPSLDPLLFIVAIHPDWKRKGVLVVDLACDYDGGTPGIARASVDEEIEAASWLVNFQISNMDWEDLEQEEEEKDWPDEFPGLKAAQEELRRVRTQKSSKKGVVR